MTGRTKNCMLILLSICLVLVVVGCSRTETKDSDDNGNATNNEIVGVLFPDEQESAEAEQIQKSLEELGYDVDLQFAGQNGETQAAQMNEMVENKVVALVVLPIDSAQLEESLSKAARQGIVVISYDRIITGTEDVSYYVGFDDKGIGADMADEIVNSKNLKTAKEEKKSYSIEFFMGALEDQNSRLEMEGMMETLKSYMDDGILVSKSFRTTYEDVSIAEESVEMAQIICSNILKANYMDTPVDVICAGSDALSAAVVSALDEEKYNNENWPTVVGGGGTSEAFARIEEGKQTLTVCRLRDELPGLCAGLVDNVLQGEEIENPGEISNGTTSIPAVFGEAEIALNDNYKELMEELGIE